jgi:hypothetical protein
MGPPRIRQQSQMRPQRPQIKPQRPQMIMTPRPIDSRRRLQINSRPEQQRNANMRPQPPSVPNKSRRSIKTQNYIPY